MSVFVPRINNILNNVLNIVLMDVVPCLRRVIIATLSEVESTRGDPFLLDFRIKDKTVRESVQPLDDGVRTVRACAELASR